MTYTSRRGRIDPPDLDDRRWQDLADQMRDLIPAYAPQWTDHNASDIGITLIELFAWLGESVIYRLNQTPVKNYIAFLNLLGIVRDPATPARTYLTFSSKAGAVTVPAGTQAQTAAAAGEDVVVFETDEDLAVLATDVKAALVVGPYATGAAASSYRNATAALIGPPTSRSPLTVPAGQALQLCLGFERAVAAELVLGVLLATPLASRAGATLSWVFSTTTTEPLAWPVVPGGRDSTAGLSHDGSARLSPPPGDWTAQRATAPPATAPPAPAPPAPGTGNGWASVRAESGTAPSTDPLFWIGLRIANPTTATLALEVERLLFNAVMARTALTIRTAELLGQSTGAPFQVFPLAHQPLFRGAGAEAAYDHLVVQVGSGPQPVWETWTLREDLPAGADRSYRVNPTTGEIMFGNFDDRTPDGHGLIPVAGSQVRARSYRYVASGAAGNVAPGRVTSLGTTPRGALPDGKPAVANLGPGFDGVDEEPVEETFRRAPEVLKVRNRAVTAEDYEFLAEQISFVQTSRCLTARRHDSDGPGTPPNLAWKAGDPWTYAGVVRAPGFVSVIIVPDQPLAVGRPEPTDEQVTMVTAFLEQRRDLTTHLQVSGPLYLPVSVDVEISLWPQTLATQVDDAEVKAACLAGIRTFLHPTRGGADGRGWAVGQPVFSSEVFAAIAPAPDVGFVSRLDLKAGIPVYHFPPRNPAGTSANWHDEIERPFPLGPAGASGAPAGGSATVRAADYELICAADDAAHNIKTVPAE